MNRQDTMRKALQAVQAGKVQKVYLDGGNVIRGAHSATVRALEDQGYVKEKKGNSGYARIYVPLELTNQGENWLADWDLAELAEEARQRTANAPDTRN